jgi:hypothetical protein
MKAYLTALLRHRGPLSVSELARETGRQNCAAGAQYGPINRLVSLGLARWLTRCGHQRLAEPTPEGQRWNEMVEEQLDGQKYFRGGGTGR